MAKNNKWSTNIMVLPMGGYFITDGFFGYHPWLGTYVRWWILDPCNVILVISVIASFTSLLTSPDIAFILLIEIAYIINIKESNKLLKERII